MHIRPERIDLNGLTAILRTALHLDNPAPLLNFGRQSELIMAYWAGQDLVAVAGFVALDLFGVEAYLWMETAPAAARYPVAVGRWGVWTMREARSRYQRIVGHCRTGTKSIEWLRSLGARFGEPQPYGGVPFVIGD